jgi:hypothetical protein
MKPIFHHGFASKLTMNVFADNVCDSILRRVDVSIHAHAGWVVDSAAMQKSELHRVHF